MQISQPACWGGGVKDPPRETETPKLTTVNMQTQARGCPRSSGHRLTCQLASDIWKRKNCDLSKNGGDSTP